MLRVTAWDDAHENNRTRELKRLDWVPVPNRMDGDGYTQLVDHEDGAAHLGAWVVILEIASRCNPRGVLVKSDGKPHDAKSLSRISRLRPEAFSDAIPRLIEIGWLTDDETSHEGARIPQDDARSPQDVAPRVRAHTPPRARIPEGKGKKEGEGTREGATECGGSAPVPPPPPSSALLGGKNTPDEVLAEFIAVAAEITGTPYVVTSERTELKLAAQIAAAAPDRVRRLQAMKSAWLDPKFAAKPALTFFALDLDRWLRTADEAIEAEIIDKRNAETERRKHEAAQERARRAEEEERARDAALTPEQRADIAARRERLFANARRA